MKTLQTTQKRPYTSPFIEVLEAENVTLLANSVDIQDDTHTLDVNNLESDTGGLVDEE